MNTSTKNTLLQLIAEADRIQLANILSQFPGYHALQIGSLIDEDFLTPAIISHHVLLQQSRTKISSEVVKVTGALDALPFLSDSIDIVLASHPLEQLEVNPSELLQEAWRVLIPEGHLILMACNPWSLLRITTRRLRNTESLTQGKWLTPGRTKRHLQRIGFEIEGFETYFFPPFLENQIWLNRFKFLEIVGKFCWPYLGGLYMFVARKRTIPITPIRPQWLLKKAVDSGLAEPTIR